MENFTSENNKYQESSEKFKKFGDLGVTAEDHLNISSSPEEDLINNHGKTLGEIWDEEKIRSFLIALKDFVSTEQDSDVMKKEQEYQKQNLEATIFYLKSIGRLPEGFE